MRVESLIKKTVELQGFRVMTVKKVADGLEAELAPDGRYAPRCGACGHRARYRDSRPARRFRHVPLWGINVHLVYAPRRVTCKRCGGVHVEAMPWVSGKRQFTRALMVTLATWTQILTWKQVASLFHCAWSTVAAAVDEAVTYGLANRDLSDVTHIGIDEISRKRGHVYVTNVYDLKRHRLLWSGEGRAGETLETFFRWFGKDRTGRLEGVCCDMWQPYVDVVKKRAPKAILVFDKFHIVQHLSKAVDQVRRDEIRDDVYGREQVCHAAGQDGLRVPRRARVAPDGGVDRAGKETAQRQPEAFACGASRKVDHKHVRSVGLDQNRLR